MFFDTSVWSPLDLLDLYRVVPPEQVVYASDYPYGRQPNSLLMALRTARAAGLDETALRMMLGGTAARIADGLPPLTPTAPLGPDEVAHPVTFARIHQYLTMASTMLWLRQADTFGVLGLALNACDEKANGHGTRPSSSASCSWRPASCGRSPARRRTSTWHDEHREAPSGSSTSRACCP